ncbi:MAG: TSUP family transporter, partial [Chromatiales bacterium]|nr:TSUP family transporter [Chromatiales bacterium]
LLSTGITPTQALATNKFQGSFGTLSASLFFIRKGVVNLREIWQMILWTFIGSASGTLLVQSISIDFLSSLIPILLILVALYFWFTPNLGSQTGKQRISYLLFAFTIGFTVGFYDGFFGPGAGSFFTIGFVTLLGFGLTKATAHTKILNFTSNISSLLVFVVGGYVIWQVGIAMAIGQFIGARIGAHLVFMRGSKLVRPMIVAISLIISVKLLLSNLGWF